MLAPFAQLDRRSEKSWAAGCWWDTTRGYRVHGSSVCLRKESIARAAVIDDAGVIPTPAIALLVKSDSYSGGIMISASHNPFEDNGIKVFSADGTKLSDAAEMEIEQRVFQLLSAGPSRYDKQHDDGSGSANHSCKYHEISRTVFGKVAIAFPSGPVAARFAHRCGLR